MHVDVSSIEQVRKAAEGMDAILNLSVLRNDGKLAFDVNTRGYNMMVVAVEQKIKRVINTGPHLVVSGPSSDRHDFGIGPDQPPQPGTHLYGLSKSLGQEICRVFAQQPSTSRNTCFSNFRYGQTHSRRGCDAVFDLVGGCGRGVPPGIGH